MLGVIQRVSQANVVVDGTVVGEIEQGILLLLGIQRGDGKAEADKMVHKLRNYRIFPDSDGKMNLSVAAIDGGILTVSQFTLAAETKKGLRPGFSNAASPAAAEDLYNYFIQQLQIEHPKVASGIFGANMKVTLCNDGPVTFMLET